MADQPLDEHLVDVEVRIFQRADEGYPVEITLNGEQGFQRGYMAADVLPWTSSGDPATDGQQLFETLFADQTLRSAWAECRGQSPKRRIRLEIDAAAAELHALPWELLHEGTVMLAAHSNTPFSRYLRIALPWGGPVEERPIGLLVVISNPDDLESEYNLVPIDVARERESLESVFTQVGPDKLQAHFLDAPATLERLEQALRGGYHVLHFVGHGAYSIRRRQAALYMQDDEGHTHRVLDDALAGMLARQGVRPRLIFLVACQSATRSTVDAFLGLGPKLVNVGVPAVVAMQDVVTIETGRKFSAAFYQRLLDPSKPTPVDQAVNEARSTLLTGGRPDAAVPVLFMRLKSGQLWGDEADARGKLLGAKPKTFWEGLIANIEYGECTPILGPRVHGRWLPTPAEIARSWARMHDYPFADKEDLGRVTQYLVSYHGKPFPRRQLLKTLKENLIERLPEELRPAEPHRGLTLTQLIQAVGWQRLVEDNPNEVHRVLADLKLPLYLTTNPDSFMVEALTAQGNDPVREICRWDTHLDELPSRFTEDDAYEPTPEAPLVYHLFGSDEEINSLVLTEDDYLHFLTRIAAERDRIPNTIREALSASSLMFVGYSLYDWEFRVLMHGLVANLDQRLGFKHVAVQLELGEVKDPKTVRDFLERYFQEADINVLLGSTAQFVAELREHWETGS
jgi:hypothetical protein